MRVSKCTVEEINYEGRSMIDVVTSIAAVSRGKDSSNNPEVRFENLLKEASNSTPGRPFEYYPVVLNGSMFKLGVLLTPLKIDGVTQPKARAIDMDVFLSKIARYSYIENTGEEYKIYTNARTLLKAGYTLKEIPATPNNELAKYKVVKIKCPMYIWAQLMTHCGLSKVSQSDRVTGSEEYWLPEDVFTKIRSKREELSGTSLCFDRVTSTLHYGDFDGLLKILLTEVSQEDAQLFFKELGYKREIWSRAPYYFKMKTFIMGGWKNDPNAWENLFLERGVYPDRWKTWAQRETVEVAKMIEAVVNK